MLGPDDLVLCSGTLQQTPLGEKIAAAADAGYQGISLWVEDVELAHASGMSNLEIRQRLDDAGLEVAELDPLLCWLGSGSLGADAMEGADQMLGRSEQDFYAVADAIGGRLINCAHPFPGAVDLDAAAEAFAGVCDRAAEHGLDAGIEFLPWTGIPDAATAAEIARRAGRKNGGILFDTWHHFRGSNDDEALGQIEGELVKAVQLNNAPRQPTGDPMTEAMHGRRLPDEGDIDVAQLIRILDRIGSRAPLGVEVFSDTLANLPPAEAARRCAEATRRIVRAARPPG